MLISLSVFYTNPSGLCTCFPDSTSPHRLPSLLPHFEPFLKHKTRPLNIMRNRASAFTSRIPDYGAITCVTFCIPMGSFEDDLDLIKLSRKSQSLSRAKEKPVTDLLLAEQPGADQRDLLLGIRCGPKGDRRLTNDKRRQAPTDSYSSVPVDLNLS